MCGRSVVALLHNFVQCNLGRCPLYYIGIYKNIPVLKSARDLENQIKSERYGKIIEDAAGEFSADLAATAQILL